MVPRRAGGRREGERGVQRRSGPAPTCVAEQRGRGTATLSSLSLRPTAQPDGRRAPTRRYGLQRPSPPLTAAAPTAATSLSDIPPLAQPASQPTSAAELTPARSSPSLRAATGDVNGALSGHAGSTPTDKQKLRWGRLQDDTNDTLGPRRRRRVSPCTLAGGGPGGPLNTIHSAESLVASHS